MNGQHSYGGGGYGAGRPPQPPMGGPGPRLGYGPSMMSPMQGAGEYGAPIHSPPASYGRPHAEPAYGGPPPPPQRDDRGPVPPPGGYGADPVQSSYGGPPPLRFDSGHPASAGGGPGGYGNGANRFEPNYGGPSHQPPTPQMRSFGGGPPPMLGPGPSYGSGDDRGDDRQFQPRKRSRVGGDDGGERGDMSYQSYLHERLKRERPCRTLFVRNIDFNSDAGELRRHFESFGELKSWFDLIPKRGIAFISYFDLRCAEAAREALQSYRLMNRDLDVHFSLPRETEMTKRCDRDKDQGSLSVALRGSPDVPGVEEIQAFFSRYGEIKSIRDYNEQPNSRLVEFYDCRATKAAYDQAIGQPYRGGTWDITFAWDLGADERLPDMQKHERDKERLRNMGYRAGDRGGGREDEGGADANERQSSFGPPDGNRAGPPGNMYGARAGGGGPPPSYGRGAGTKRSFDQDDGYQQQNEPPMRRWGQPAGGQQVRPAVDSGYGPRRPANADGPPPPSVAPPYASPPVAARPPVGGGAAPSGHGASNAGTDDVRLLQAQKVQQLLASLKPAAAAAATSNAVQPARPPQAAPSALPSNLAALLQMAQSKANGQSAQR